MQGITEKTILKRGFVRITNLRAIFGTKCYELSNITSASVKVDEPSLFLPVFFAIILGVCSVLVGVSNMREYAMYVQVGLYLGIAAILFFIISRKTKYEVQIRNPISELTVFQTYDGDYAQKVVGAINEAIANLEEPNHLTARNYRVNGGEFARRQKHGLKVGM